MEERNGEVDCPLRRGIPIRMGTNLCRIPIHIGRTSITGMPMGIEFVGKSARRLYITGAIMIPARILGFTQKVAAGIFTLYLALWLGVFAPSHRHEFASHHEDCKVCQVSSQPYAAAPPAVCPEFAIHSILLPEVAEAPALPSRYFAFSARGPPSV